MSSIVLLFCLWINAARAFDDRSGSDWFLFQATRAEAYAAGKAFGPTVPLAPRPLWRATTAGVALGLADGGLTALSVWGAPDGLALVGAGMVVGGPLLVGHFAPIPACRPVQSGDFTVACRLADARAPERRIRRRVILGEGVGLALSVGVVAAVAAVNPPPAR